MDCGDGTVPHSCVSCSPVIPPHDHLQFAAAASSSSPLSPPHPQLPMQPVLSPYMYDMRSPPSPRNWYGYNAYFWHYYTAMLRHAGMMAQSQAPTDNQ